MSDLISRAEVEKVIKEFNKCRVDRIPPNLSQEQHCNICDTILDENVELLDAIYALPTAYDVEKVVERLGHPNNYTIVAGNHYTTVERVVDIVRNGGKE